MGGAAFGVGCWCGGVRCAGTNGHAALQHERCWMWQAAGVAHIVYIGVACEGQWGHANCLGRTGCNMEDIRNTTCLLQSLVLSCVQAEQLKMYCLEGHEHHAHMHSLCGIFLRRLTKERTVLT